MDAIHTDFAHLSDRAELLDFLHGVFLRRNPTHPRFEELFPDLFDDDADIPMERHAVIRVNGRIAACVGAYPMTLRLRGCDIPLVGIGQVSTGAAHLGRGYMSTLLREQLARAREEGAALAWLGGRHDRYSRFGFETAGLAFQYGLDARSVREVPRIRVVEKLAGNPSEGIPPALFALRDRTCSSVVEPPARYLRRLRRARFEIWTATPPGDSEPDAWILFNADTRKADEFSGSADGCLEICAALAERDPQGIRAMPSLTGDALSEGLRRACSWVSASMNNLSVLDAGRLLDAFRPILPDDCPVPSDDLGPGPMARLLFGPEPSDFPVHLPFHLPDVFHI